ncbi:hypothetical protein [Methanogenium cariaci]|uniref:hypothetical protein n=1 Tax=Methanogenium cariaci TaxID=2197 RepID=UPI001FE1C62D|nr:hypothetical protein [Methanogenium cariaci]
MHARCNEGEQCAGPVRCDRNCPPRSLASSTTLSVPFSPTAPPIPATGFTTKPINISESPGDL